MVVVTHDTALAESAKRVITMRDGEIRSDLRNDRPVDAAAALAALPLSAAESDELSP